MTSTEEFEAQLEATRRQLEALTAEVARNDEIMRRAQMRELRLLQATTVNIIVKISTAMVVMTGVVNGTDSAIQRCEAQAGPNFSGRLPL